MTLANDSFLLIPDGSGTALPTHLISAKEHTTQMLSGDAGNLHGSADTYFAFFDYSNADATAHDIFDFYNASASIVRIVGIWCVNRQDTAITFGTGGNVEKPARIDYSKTSAVGTGGTALTYNGTSGGTFVPKDPNNTTLSASITGRTAPTGGATADQFLFPAYVRLNTTSVSGGLTQFLNLLPINARGEQELILETNEGVKARQPADLSSMITAGSAGFYHLLSFEVI